MVGDNRDNSGDSRFAVRNGGAGNIPSTNIIGKAEIVLLSVEDDFVIYKPWTWLNLRGDRFLGDRVLGLLTAKTLFESTATKEGIMATRLNALVRKETCARIARDLDLGDVLLLSPSEDKQGGRNKTSILGDACEALLGAIYLDGGLQAVEKFYEEHWQVELTKVLNKGTKDPKTKLQEFALAQGKFIPVYKVKERSGPDHNPSFTMSVSVEGLGSADGIGRSKKDAERSAAKALLEQVKT